MATIYLRHPHHGTKVAIAEAEAVADEKNGWERYSIAAVLMPDAELDKQVVTGSDIEEAELAEFRLQWEAKYGKPPHHRKSLETLRAEVGG